MIWAAVLFVLGVVLVVNPFEELGMMVIVKLIGVSLVLDGIGNLVGIFWIGHVLKGPKKKKEEPQMVEAEICEETESSKVTPFKAKFLESKKQLPVEADEE